MIVTMDDAFSLPSVPFSHGTPLFVPFYTPLHLKQEPALLRALRRSLQQILKSFNHRCLCCHLAPKTRSFGVLRNILV
jgi:hypothetical protein